MLISTGSKDVDDFLKGGFPSNEVFMVYGGPASGKTTLAFQLSLDVARKGKKVIFIDVEGTFSLDRLRQMDSNCDLYLENIKVFYPKSFDDLEKIILNLHFNVGLVVVDSLSKYYRDEKKIDPSGINVRLITQLRKLHKFVDKEIPVLVTNQVYSSNLGVQVVGGNMIKRWSQFLIRLQKEPRVMFLEKPRFEQFEFKIVNEGIAALS